MNNKKSKIIIIISLIAFLAIVVFGFSYAFFENSILESNVSVVADLEKRALFTSKTSNDMKFNRLTSDNLKNNVTVVNSFNETVTSYIFVDYSGKPGSYCTYDIVYNDNGDEYTKIYDGGNLKTDDFYLTWNYNGTGTDAFSQGTIHYGSLNHNANTNIVSSAKITIPDSGEDVHYTWNISGVFWNRSYNQGVNAGKLFSGTLKTNNVKCYLNGQLIIQE